MATTRLHNRPIDFMGYTVTAEIAQPLSDPANPWRPATDAEVCELLR